MPDNKYLNPWADDTNIKRAEYYQNDAPLVLEHRGVKVYKLWDTRHDYVFKGVCIMQRTTAKDTAIDKILDGIDPCDSKVSKHLNKHGFKALSYDEYTKLWQKGERD